MSISAAPTERDLIRTLLDEGAPGDALAAYYALYHDRARAAVFLHTDPSHPARPDGFLVRAQTGQDLFRPLVTFRASSTEVAESLFRRGLQGGRPNYVTVPAPLAGYVNRLLTVSDASIFRVFRLDREHFKPIINIFVTVERGPDNWPRYEIRQSDRVPPK